MLKYLSIVCLLIQTGIGSLIPPKLDWSQVGKGRIVGGEPAADGEFPWQVSIRQIGNIGATHFCGGTIINENWVMTAAHCCAGQTPHFMHIVAGGIKLNSYEFEEETRDVDNIIRHPEYDSQGLTNDICLLKLSDPLQMTDYIKSIALPESMSETEAGTKATVTGWGLTAESEVELPNTLRKVVVPVVSDDECREYYSSTNAPDIAASMICAGLPEGGKDSCQGDSGGPFIDAVRKTLLGVVSWGLGCGRAGSPGVYTQVSYFVDWIEETMANN